MPSHRDIRVLPYTPEQMYALVADVKRYAEFLPWVVATRIRAESDTAMTADMVVGFKHLREKFTSQVTLEPHSRIAVEYLDGPLKNLENQWLFRPHAQGCEVDFHVSFTFRNRLFEQLAGQYFDRAFGKMVEAFEARAAALYGNNSSSATSTA